MIQFIQLFGAFHDTIYSIVLNLELIYSSFPGRNKIFFVILLNFGIHRAQVCQ